MADNSLLQYLPKKTIAIAAGYHTNGVYVTGCTILENNRLELFFPKSHHFRNGDTITLHLDNRTGVDQFDADLRVYRLSYKGVVKNVSSSIIMVEAVEFIVMYSMTPVAQYRAPGYEFPADNRTEVLLEESPLTGNITINEKEIDNKLGVWVTKAVDRPHTTVMAFLSTPEDDIFLISHPSTFKSQLIYRNPECHFAIDHRADYIFEKAIDWNYTIIEAKTYRVSPETKLFNEIQRMFIDKNPWETTFFAFQGIEMFHLQPQKIIIP